MEQETKVCTKCGKQLPLSEFSKNNKSRDGLQWRCKSCQSEENRMRTRLSKGGFVNPELAQFTPRQLIEELRNRGYKGTLTYTQQINL